MGIELKGQALALVLAAVLGTVLGVLYDLLRPVRRRTGRVTGALLDALFCFASGAAAFAYAMGAGNGRLGLWELTAVLIGFLLYMHTLSRPFLHVFSVLLELLLRIAGALKNCAERTAALTKKALGVVGQWLRKQGEKLSKKRKAPEEEEVCIER